MGYATSIDAYISKPVSDKLPAKIGEQLLVEILFQLTSADSLLSSGATTRGRSDVSEHGALEKRGVSADTVTSRRKKKELDDWVKVGEDQSLKSFLPSIGHGHSHTLKEGSIKSNGPGRLMQTLEGGGY